MSDWRMHRIAAEPHGLFEMRAARIAIQLRRGDPRARSPALQLREVSPAGDGLPAKGETQGEKVSS